MGEIHTPEPGVFENVTVTLYRTHGVPLCTRDVGSIQKDGGRRNVSISWPTIPRYGIIDSADIWQSKMGMAEYYNITGDGRFVRGGTVNSRDGLPVDATEKSKKPCNE